MKEIKNVSYPTAEGVIGGVERKQKRFIIESKEKSEELGLTYLSTPVFVRWCEEHQRFEWCDPFSRKGGVAPNIESLRKSLKKHYRCPDCGAFHVYSLYFDGDLVNFWKFVEEEV